MARLRWLGIPLLVAAAALLAVAAGFVGLVLVLHRHEAYLNAPAQPMDRYDRLRTMAAAAAASRLDRNAFIALLEDLAPNAAATVERKPSPVTENEFVQTLYPVVPTLDEWITEPQAPRTPVPRASLAFAKRPRVIVILTLSGGGSRAANFSAAVLERLQTFGMLRHVSVVSAVSGGGLVGAYYALHGMPPSRDSIRANFWRDFLTKYLRPDVFAATVLTPLGRSDVMATVFDHALYRGATFAALNRWPDGPKLFLNATSVTGETARFTFSEEDFAQINSRIDTFPLASAVMASGAFPGAFNDVTLRTYFSKELRTYDGFPTRAGDIVPDRYLHLVDGGASDNLGVDTVRRLVEGAGSIPCFMFVVDAHVFPRSDTLERRLDARSFSDRFIDRNALAAIDALFNHRRATVLDEFRKIEEPEVGSHVNLRRWTPYPSVNCVVWHIALADLRDQWVLSTADARAHLFITAGGALYEVTRQIETHYTLTGVKNCSAEELQRALYTAATILVGPRPREGGNESSDPDLTAFAACDWFRRHGLDVSPMCGDPKRTPLDRLSEVPGLPDFDKLDVPCVRDQ